MPPGRDRTRHALVTGAGSGIGRATAVRLAQAGYAVALVGRRRRELEETARACASAGGRAVVETADVGDPAEVDNAIAAVQRRFGRLEALVNNAGQAAFGTVETTPLEVWERLFRVNVTGAFLVSRAALPLLRAGERPAVVNVASTLGLVGMRRAAAYCASKAALVNLTRAMALDHAGEGIRVNAVCPGAVDTPMLRAPRGDEPASDARLERLGGRHPVGRIGRPEEIAEAIFRLLDPAFSFVTGTVLVADGGLTAGFAE
ncbi:MAG: SDR family oxidoreductase [Acidobacteria bacterium]|nr:MAG: SDR family oxidoreductase [Acidobacteriota bacterium]